MLDITVIGTAALFPRADRALAAVAATCAGSTILFDCGEGTQSAALRAGLNLARIDLIALTHYHGDHIYGLPGLLQTLGNCMSRTEPLYITGPENIAADLSLILRLTGALPYELRLIEIPPEGLSMRSLFRNWPEEATLTAFPTEHRVPSQGYCLTLARMRRFMPERAAALGVPVQQWKVLQKGEAVEHDGRMIMPEEVLGEPRKGIKFAISGDTVACETMAEAVRGADLLVSEATYGEDEQAELAREHGHMNFAQAAELAARAQVCRLWLTHYSQMIEDPEEYLPNARRYFENAESCEDGKKMRLEYDANE